MSFGEGCPDNCYPYNGIIIYNFSFRGFNVLAEPLDIEFYDPPKSGGWFIGVTGQHPPCKFEGRNDEWKLQKDTMFFTSKDTIENNLAYYAALGLIGQFNFTLENINN